MGVEVAFTYVCHPHSNGTVENANALIFSAIKKILRTSQRASEQSNCWGQYGVITPPFAEWQISPLSGCCMAKRPVTPEEIKLHSAITKVEAIYSSTKAESKDLLEPEHMKAVKNL
jgi:hypothetical protein